MKLKIALVLFMAITSLCAQTKFEKGYFITTTDKKVECLIKNEDWINTPEKIQYKLNENSQIITIKKSSLNKLQIEGKILLERHNVFINRYSKNLNQL